MEPGLPSFEEWVTYCFEQGSTESDSQSDAHRSERGALFSRGPRFLRLEPVRVTEYLTRLFENSSSIADRFSNDQIGAATWFIFGSGSEYIRDVGAPSVLRDDGARCVRSIAAMYTDLFDRVCGRRGTDPDTDLTNTDRVDVAVYMIWDMNALEFVAISERHPHFIEPGLEVLRTVLHRCRTSTCLISALHGAGHLYMHHSENGDQRVAHRLQGVIDDFLKAREPPGWVVEYAMAAREGWVQ